MRHLKVSIITKNLNLKYFVLTGTLTCASKNTAFQDSHTDDNERCKINVPKNTRSILIYNKLIIFQRDWVRLI